MALNHFNNISISAIVSALPSDSSYPIAEELQTTADLGFEAAEKIFTQLNIKRDSVGIILFVSRTPDYRGPATSIVLQHRLGLSQDCIAFDVNHSKSGFVHGMQIACSNLESINKDFALLIVGDTTSKQTDKNLALPWHFGDGAAAILIEKKQQSEPIILATYTDSNGVPDFIIPGGAFRNRDESADQSAQFLQINAPSFFSFVKDRVPLLVNDFSDKTAIKISDIDYVLLNPTESKLTNDFIDILSIPKEKVLEAASNHGDTCGNAIPLIMSSFGKRVSGKKLLSIVYGEGFSAGILYTVLSEDVYLDVISTASFFSNGFVTHEM